MARWPARLVVSVVVAAGVVACTDGGRADGASMTVRAATALLDRPVTVSIAGLKDDRPVTVTATATDAVGRTWSSSADFRVGGDGRLSLDQAPVGGSYSGADPMGLFQFMATEDPRSLGFAAPLSGTYDVRLEARAEGATVAEATATRQSPGAAGVTTKTLTVPADGVYGTLSGRSTSLPESRRWWSSAAPRVG